MRRPVFLALVIIIFSSIVSAGAVINSDNWRDIGKGIERAGEIQEDFFVVDSPGELYVAESTLQGDQVLFNTDSPALAGIETRSAINFARTESISWEEIRESDSYVVIKPDFGTDMVSVLPYVIQRNSSIIFYRDELRQRIEELEGEKLFYGDYSFEPGQYFDDVEHLDRGWQENNFEIVSRLESNWATISPRTYFNPEVLSENDPVLLKSDLREMSSFLEDSSIENLRVIGYSNLVYAQRLKDMTTKDLNIAVKTGRVFTGSSELDGRYDLKKIDIPHRSYSLEIGSTSIDRNNSDIEVKLVNTGSTDRRVVIHGNLSEEQFRSDDIAVPSFTSLVYRIGFEGEYNNSLNLSVNPETGESLTLDAQPGVGSDTASEKQFAVNNRTYNASKDVLKVNVGVTSDSPRWVMLQSRGKYEKEFLEPGTNKTITLDYIDEDHQEYSVMGGGFENQFNSFSSYSIDESFLFGTNELGFRLLIVFALFIFFLLAVAAVKFRKLIPLEIRNHENQEE